MSAGVSRLSREDLARRGDDTFATTIRPTLRPDDEGKFVAIDVVSGEYEIDADDYAAVTRLHRRTPGAQVWLVRAGHTAACRIGSAR